MPRRTKAPKRQAKNLASPVASAQAALEPDSPSSVSSKTEPSSECRFCKLTIQPGARVCHHCRVPQALYWVDRFGAGTLLALLLSLAMATLSSCNTFLSQRKEAQAEHALELSGEALRKAQRADALATDLETMKRQMKDYAAENYGVNCLALDGVFDSASGECVLPGGRTIRFITPFPD